MVEGDRPVNQAAFAIHSQVHAARPDVVAAAHSHSVYGKSWSTLGRLLDPITQDACAFYDDHALFDDYTGVVLDTEEGKRIAYALGTGKAVILRNHGLLTVGHTVEEAVWWFITMERSCQAQLLAEAAGTPILIDHDMALMTAGQVGTHQSGWFSFQPLWDRIVAGAARPARLTCCASPSHGGRFGTLRARRNHHRWRLGGPVSDQNPPSEPNPPDPPPVRSAASSSPAAA